MQLSQPLSEDGTRYDFAKEQGVLLEGNSCILHVIWVSTEAHIHFNSYTNKKNVRFGASENERLAAAKPLHSERLTVLCPFSSISEKLANNSGIENCIFNQRLKPFL
jgi:hypothetical protein